MYVSFFRWCDLEEDAEEDTEVDAEDGAEEDTEEDAEENLIRWFASYSANYINFCFHVAWRRSEEGVVLSSIPWRTLRLSFWRRHFDATAYGNKVWVLI